MEHFDIKCLYACNFEIKMISVRISFIIAGEKQSILTWEKNKKPYVLNS